MNDVPQQDGGQATTDDTDGEHHEEDGRDVQSRDSPFETRALRASLWRPRPILKDEHVALARGRHCEAVGQAFRLAADGTIDNLAGGLLGPQGIAIAPEDSGPGQVYVADSANNRVAVLNGSGGATSFAGDTDVFGDMALIQKFFKPNLALACIGGHFTMDPERAAYALRELIRPKQVIPMHYGTFPVINRTPAELKAALGDAPIKVLDVKPGDAVKF